MNKKELIEALEKADDDVVVNLYRGEGWIDNLLEVEITFINGDGKIILR